MSIDFLDRRRAERFAQLLDETNGGPRHHSQGRGDDELAELVTVGTTMTALRTAVHAPVDPEFRAGLRAMLIATAERDGIGATADADASEEEPRRRFALGAGSGRRLRARGAIVAGVAVGAVAVSGMSFASEDAVPGDALYGVKRSAEKAQLALAGSDVSRGQLFLAFARNRLTEASAVQSGGLGLAGVLTDMDADTREGVRLLNTSAVQRKDEAPLNAVESFVTAQRRLMQPLLARLGTADSESARASLGLLDAVEKRVNGLRSSVECGTIGADGLGPLPQTCSAAPQRKQNGGDATGTERRTTGQQQEQGAERGQNGKAQQGTGPATGTGAEQQDGTNRNPGTAPTDEPADGPSADAVPPGDQSTQEDEGVLDRILGGILG